LQHLLIAVLPAAHPLVALTAPKSKQSLHIGWVEPAATEKAVARSPHRADPRSATAIDQIIGDRIRARRLEINVSQERLAEAIGVTFQQIQKYEKGVNRVSAATLIRIADALDAQVPALLPKGAGKSGAAQSLAMDAPSFGELGAVFTQLNDAGRKVLLATARTFAGVDEFKARAGDAGGKGKR
jgi:transcriptional regulator with XRE-family HTH domain